MITKGMKIGIAIMLLGLIIGFVGLMVNIISSAIGLYQHDFAFACMGINFFLWGIGGIITIGSPLVDYLRSK